MTSVRYGDIVMLKPECATGFKLDYVHYCNQDNTLTANTLIQSDVKIGDTIPFIIYDKNFELTNEEVRYNTDIILSAYSPKTNLDREPDLLIVNVEETIGKCNNPLRGSVLTQSNYENAIYRFTKETGVGNDILNYDIGGNGSKFKIATNKGKNYVNTCYDYTNPCGGTIMGVTNSNSNSCSSGNRDSSAPIVFTMVPYFECTADVNGKVCINGRLRNPCQEDVDCLYSEICYIDKVNYCRAIYCTNEFQSNCFLESGEVCKDNSCYQAECFSNKDCVDGKCLDSVCIVNDGLEAYFIIIIIIIVILVIAIIFVIVLIFSDEIENDTFNPNGTFTPIQF